MRFLDLFKPYNPTHATIQVTIPRQQIHAIETLLYMENSEELSRDYIIGEALDMYLKKRIWAAREKTEYVTQVKQVPGFGMKQSKSPH